jgi:hypothetical protein
VEHLDGRALEAAFDAVEGVVDDAFGNGFLAVDHQVVHELGQNAVAELGVGQDFAFLCAMAAGHGRISLTWGAWRRISNGAACGP